MNFDHIEDPLVKDYMRRKYEGQQKIDGAQKQADLAGYAGIAANAANQLIDSQRSPVILENRMQDLGKKHQTIEPEKSNIDMSSIQKMADQGVQTARQSAADDQNSFFTEQKLQDMSANRSQQKNMSDPSSAESQHSREMLLQMVPSAKDIPNFDQMTAVQAEKYLGPMMQRERGLREDDYKRQTLDNQRAKITYDKEQKANKPTVGEDQMDRVYAKALNDFTHSGRNNAISGIDRLEKIAAELEAEGDGMFADGGGRFSDITPDFARSRNSIKWRDESRNVANKTLKDLFGGIISDSERESAAKEYYNDSLDNKENARILRNKIADLRANLASQTDKAMWWEENGTMRGFKQVSAATGGRGASGNWDGPAAPKVMSADELP